MHPLALRATILSIVRRMDDEAAARPDGRPTGLWWYGGHARPELKRPQTEVEWSRRLGALLTEAGYPSRREVHYPDRPRDRCDLVVTLPGRRRLWLEVKGTWKDYWATRRMAIYRAYLFHPLAGTPSMGKNHTAALDILKLARLGPADADIAALLLIAFDTPAAPVAPDLDRFEALAALDAAPWTPARDHWADAHVPGRGVHVRLWSRPVE